DVPTREDVDIAAATEPRHIDAGAVVAPAAHGHVARHRDGLPPGATMRAPRSRTRPPARRSRRPGAPTRILRPAPTSSVRARRSTTEPDGTLVLAVTTQGTSGAAGGQSSAGAGPAAVRASARARSGVAMMAKATTTATPRGSSYFLGNHSTWVCAGRSET